MMSIFGASFAPAYAASKGGIVQFTRSCAVAWAADNIQANAVLPGWIDTDLTKRARKEIDGLHDRVLARTPAARWGAIADFAGIAVFLASPASDFVTGTAIPVDGGFSVMGLTGMLSLGCPSTLQPESDPLRRVVSRRRPERPNRSLSGNPLFCPAFRTRNSGRPAGGLLVWNRVGRTARLWRAGDSISGATPEICKLVAFNRSRRLSNWGKNHEEISLLPLLPLAVGTVSASAADLAARPYTKAPVAVAAVYSWTGSHRWQVGYAG